MTDGVGARLLEAAGGAKVGVLTLDAPSSLNALSLPMITALHGHLARWASDDAVRAVWLEGAGERAFCAGGDIRSFYHRRDEAGLFAYASDFFEREYRLDHAIHTYPKPVLCLGHGIVMGGGIGLLAGARFRILTEQSLLAMPEVSIGLFPDVAGSWFLPRMPGRLGLWLGLTGARFNGSDALALGLADGLIPAARRGELKARLLEIDWQLSGEALDQAIHEQIYALGMGMEAPAPRLLPHQGRIDALLAGRAFPVVLAQLLDADLADEPELAAAQAQCRAGSPLSRALVWQQYTKARQHSLAEIFADELTLAVNCALHGDFIEGVRALLIDKDKRPRWRFASEAEIPSQWLERMWQWPSGRHPLWSELGRG